MRNKTPVTQQSFPVNEPVLIKLKVLNWVKQFSTFCLLDNHGYQLPHQSMEYILAVGIKKRYSANADGTALSGFQLFLDNHHGWLFGHLGYDLKAETEGVPVTRKSKSGFADIHFFEPEILLRLSNNEICIEGVNPQQVWNDISRQEIDQSTTGQQQIVLRSSVTKEEYIETIHQLKEHILRGDCYEINFCINFFTENFTGDPVAIYQRLSSFSPNPFSVLYKNEDQWLICASPERFIRKEKNTIISQPIKGTAARMHQDLSEDINSREKLYASQKDRSENVMVVDLVRNDLSKICTEGTVKVDELFGVYSFPQVHQMISTVSGELQDGVSFTDMLRATFPMGSMTGAPKHRVTELIEKYEKESRGIFSGAVGYISPSQNSDGGQAAFDFNVVIRSIIYNSSTGYLSFPAGSGITFYSNPESEWEECLLKATAMKKALGF